ncbi:hypothetical protein BH10PSE17_BH10PSE17_10500 [soil metagenome]
MWFFRLRQPAPAGAAALARPVSKPRARPVVSVVRSVKPAIESFAGEEARLEARAAIDLRLQAEHEARRDRVIERVLGSGSLQRW